MEYLLRYVYNIQEHLRYTLSSKILRRKGEDTSKLDSSCLNRN